MWKLQVHSENGGSHTLFTAGSREELARFVESRELYSFRDKERRENLAAMIRNNGDCCGSRCCPTGRISFAEM